jgi:hypothetical protein
VISIPTSVLSVKRYKVTNIIASDHILTSMVNFFNRRGFLFRSHHYMLSPSVLLKMVMRMKMRILFLNLILTTLLVLHQAQS